MKSTKLMMQCSSQWIQYEGLRSRYVHFLPTRGAAKLRSLYETILEVLRGGLVASRLDPEIHWSERYMWFSELAYAEHNPQWVLENMHQPNVPDKVLRWSVEPEPRVMPEVRFTIDPRRPWTLTYTIEDSQDSIPNYEVLAVHALMNLRHGP